MSGWLCGFSFFIHLISIVVLPGHWFHWPADDGADSAKKQSGKTPTDESRDHYFTVLTMLHYVGLINSPTPSISFLESAKPRQPTEDIPNKTTPQRLPLTVLYWHSSKDEYNYICFTLNFTKPMCHSFSTSYFENNDSFRAEEDTVPAIFSVYCEEAYNLSIAILLHSLYENWKSILTIARVMGMVHFTRFIFQWWQVPTFLNDCSFQFMIW